MHDKGFPSTSIKAVNSFSRDPEKKNILVFNLPKGSNAAYISPYSRYGENRVPSADDEREVLMDRNQMWRITHVERVKMRVSAGIFIEKRLIHASVFTKPDRKIREVFKGNK